MIYVLSQRKGGSGKSTVAVNFTVALMSEGFQTGLLDTDTQQSSYNWFKRREQVSTDNHKLAMPECYHAEGDVRDNIRSLASRNQHVVIDTAGFDSKAMRYAVTLADVVIVPFRPKAYDLEVAPTHFDLISQLSIANPKMKMAAVLNQCPTHRSDTRSRDARKFLEELGYGVLDTKLYNREPYGDSGQDGMGVIEYATSDSGKKAAQEITNLTKELLNA